MKDLNEALHHLHLWAGLPSLDQMSGLCGWRISRSTLHTAFTQARLPRWDTVETLVEILGTRARSTTPEQEIPRFLELWTAASDTKPGDSAAREETPTSSTDTDHVLIRFVAAAQERNAREQEDREALLHLQWAMLHADVVETPGITIATRYRPAIYWCMGGDFYDVIPLPDGRTGVAVGDVMGSGPSAVALMGQLRAGMRAFASMGLPPQEVMERSNNLMLGISGSSWIATGVYGIVDPGTRRFTFTSAGHPPLLLRAPGGASGVAWGNTGLAFGVADNPNYQATEMSLPPDAMCLLYTDGLIARRQENFDAGLAHLLNRFSASTGPPPAVCDALLAHQAPGSDEDDRVLLAFTLDNASESVGMSPSSTTPSG
ncbi:PP2C family protein-serine/threonine phosphatase [Embleya sp. NPDC127516]|uniref:PP2C family protein-serine/threonine phosphatase n=1 Tax=Embleya sp. NPDC127516 TaxID=3363990 RepID=UPI00380B2351